MHGLMLRPIKLAGIVILFIIAADALRPTLKAIVEFIKEMTPYFLGGVGTIVGSIVVVKFVMWLLDGSRGI